MISRLNGSPFFDPPLRNPGPPLIKDLTLAMVQWRKDEPEGLAVGLKTMRLMADFCSPSAKNQEPVRIDTSAMLEIMREMTAIMDQQRLEPFSNVPRNRVWTYGGGQRHLNLLVEAHVLSYTAALPQDAVAEDVGGRRSQPARRSWMSSWCGYAAASHLYAYSVLGLQDAEQPAIGCLARRSLAHVEREVVQTEHEVWSAEGDRSMRDYWFWKAFTAAFALARFVRNEVLDAETASLRALRSSLYRSIRHWKQTTQAKGWGDARAALTRVVWPAAYLRPGAAEAVWVEVFTQDEGC
jgi:hypothetical protein